MAHCTGQGVIGRQAPIEEQFATELHFFLGDRIVIRNWNCWQPERRRVKHSQQVGFLAAPRLQADRLRLVISPLITVPEITGILLQFLRIVLCLSRYRQQEQQRQKPQFLFDW